jgi:hypothetical protein
VHPAAVEDDDVDASLKALAALVCLTLKPKFILEPVAPGICPAELAMRGDGPS